MSETSSRGKKREISEEEISGYIDQGYYFRVKEVNGKKYITRRKGREEKSLGRYAEKVWLMILRAQNQIDAISEKPTETISDQPDEKPKPDTRGTLDQLKEEISLSKALIMFTNCMHITEGLCTYWHWETRPAFFDTLDKFDGVPESLYELTDIVQEGRIDKRWAVKAQVVYCMNCPAYISEKDIAFVEVYKHFRRR
jgi:hypothetical protein